MSSNPGCLGLFLSLFSLAKPATAITFPYGLRDHFLSPAELSFHHVLRTIVRDSETLLTKVNLNDLFFVRRPHKNKGAHNKINRKHVDFVLCDTKSMQPLIAIELDDRSHNRPDRQKRDEFVDGVFEAADLPLLHIKAARSYNPKELRDELDSALGRN